MEEPAPLRLLQGKAMWGNIEWELVHPLKGKTIYREFLDTHGEGIHHLGFNVRNYDELFEKIKKACPRK